MTEDLIREQKEQQRLEDDYWGKGSERVEQIKKEGDEDGS